MEWIVQRNLSFSSLRAEMKQIGRDFQITVEGGEKPHIGCVVLAVPRPSLKDSSQTSCTSSVINLTGHKDEAVCRILAEQVASAKNATVICTGGFHIDHISEEQLSEVIRAANEIAGELVCKKTDSIKGEKNGL